MKSKILMLLGLLLILCPLSINAQTDYQARELFHPTLDISKHWFATGWVIGNVPNATESWSWRGGLGYRREKWALEMMYKQQFKGQQHISSALDFRFTRPLPGKLALFAEVTPALNRKSVYDMVTLERKMCAFCSFGGETENTHRAGRDSLGAGPSMSLWKQIGNTKVVLRAAYQIRPEEKNVFRIYLIFHTKLRKVS